MSLAILTLPTNKSISTVSDHVRKIGQGEAGQKLEVIVTDADGSGYNLDGKTLEFSENKEGGKIVSDNDQGHFEIKDAKAGRFVYTLAPAVYAASGVAWFDITSADGSVIDTTKNFNIDVIEDESIHINNDNYVSSLASFETHYDGVIKKAKEDSEALLTKIDGQLSQALADNNKKAADSLTDQKAQLQKLIDSTNQLQTDWNAQFTKQKQSLADVDASWQTQSKKIQDDANSKIAEIESNADTQKNAIQQAADDQLKANKNANDAEIADVKKQLADELAKVEADKTTAIQGVTDARDKAISDATDKLTAKLQSVQADYDSWKTSTASDFQAKLDKLTQQLNTDETDQASLRQAIDSAKEAVSKLHDVDFTVYAHKSDLDNYYTKAESDQKLGQKITFVKCDSPQAAHDVSMKPAADGSIVFGIYDMNNEPSQAVVGDQKINIEWLYNHLNDLSTQVSGLSSLQSLINGKADSATVYTKSDTDSIVNTLKGLIAGKANSADVYTKSDTDNIVNALKELIANAGKVKTVNNVQPDSSGNIAIDLSGKADKNDVNNLQTMVTGLSTKVDSVVTKLSDGTLAKVAHFKASEEQQAVDWSKDDGKGGLPKIGIIDG